MNDDRKAAPPPSPPRPLPPPAGLTDALRQAAVDLRLSVPPPALKARVLAAAQAAAAARAEAPPSATKPGGFWPRGWRAAGGAQGGGVRARPPGYNGRWAWSGAAVCVAVLAGSALLMLRVPPPGAADDEVRFGSADGGFLPLVPPERWPREAAAAWLVSTELPGERLAALGLPYDPAHAGDSVRAELLLHPSGEVLAVRFLH